MNYLCQGCGKHISLHTCLMACSFCYQPLTMAQDACSKNDDEHYHVACVDRMQSGERTLSK